MPVQLSERQQLTIASALTMIAALVIIAAIAGIFLLVGLFFQRFSTVFLPVAVAGVAALVLKPYYEWLIRRLKLHFVVALVVVFLSLLLPLVGLGWFFGAILVEQITSLIEKAPRWYEQVSAWLERHWPQVVDFWQTHPLAERIRGYIETHQERLLSSLQLVGDQAISAGRGVLRIVGNALAWAVLPVYFAFFLMFDTSRFKAAGILPFFKESTRKDVVYLANEFVSIIVAFFRGQLIIALAQGVLFAIGFSAVGLSYGLLLGLILGFLNIVPYLGSIIGLAIALPLALFQQDGGLLLVALVLIVFTAVQMIEGYLLTPRIMGNQTGLHPMVIIIAIFFWGSALNGIAGMILAIPLTAFLVVFWRLARDRYITEVV